VSSIVALESACKFLCEMVADVLKKKRGGGFQPKTHKKLKRITAQNDSILALKFSLGMSGTAVESLYEKTIPS
jgi:hypothetical protein